MSTFPGTPRLIKGGLVLIDPVSAAVQQVITLQYNPDTITRTLQVQSVGETADRSEALRLKGPPVETISLEAEIDASDQLAAGDSSVSELGVAPQLAALEATVYPASSQLQQINGLAQSGTLEIIPMQAPLMLFVWSKNRVMPVRISDFSITEQAFDPALNPIRAKVSLSLRVLSISDLPFNEKGGNLYMIYQQQKEQLVSRGPGGTLGALGLGGIP
ncbi:MAG: hypothetical protein U9R25_06675 [Chloroflexota bacterium]|nr:hypothetical protein [Chloroflexota bacterium]